MENNDVAETVERVGASTHPTLAGEFNFWGNNEEIIRKFQEIDGRNRK